MTYSLLLAFLPQPLPAASPTVLTGGGGSSDWTLFDDPRLYRIASDQWIIRATRLSPGQHELDRTGTDQEYIYQYQH